MALSVDSVNSVEYRATQLLELSKELEQCKGSGRER